MRFHLHIQKHENYSHTTGGDKDRTHLHDQLQGCAHEWWGCLQLHSLFPNTIEVRFDTHFTQPRVKDMIWFQDDVMQYHYHVCGHLLGFQDLDKCSAQWRRRNPTMLPGVKLHTLVTTPTLAMSAAPIATYSVLTRHVHLASAPVSLRTRFQKCLLSAFHEENMISCDRFYGYKFRLL
ncbi:hypothetical protein J6590_035436 [Homalodisca vitripennis]|nr:hypothetical protein J6590_035436 [Homalodisca vitripennis]